MILPAGKYYIGDPCYVLDAAAMNAVTDKMTSGEAASSVFEVNGHMMWAHFTQYGDGAFADQNGAEYPVDSAALSAVPIDLVKNPEGEEHGTVIEFDMSFTVNYKNGVFWFGDICIDTNSDVSNTETDLDPLSDGGYNLNPKDDQFW